MLLYPLSFSCLMRNEQKDLTEKKSSWMINNLLDVWCVLSLSTFTRLFCIVNRPAGSSKYGTACENTHISLDALLCSIVEYMYFFLELCRIILTSPQGESKCKQRVNKQYYTPKRLTRYLLFNFFFLPYVSAHFS